jgi:hypothetical protein
VTQIPPTGPQSPWPPQPGAFPPPQQSNGWSIASLICGLLLCIPGLTSLLAVIFGIAGIKKSARPQIGGRGLAIAGLVLGILGLLGWAGVAGGTWWGWGFFKSEMLNPAKQTAGTFLNDLSAGDFTKARAAATSDMSDNELKDLSEALKGMGSFKDFSLSGFDAKSLGGDSVRMDLNGTANFQNGRKSFSATFSGNRRDGFKIEDFVLK